MAEEISLNERASIFDDHRLHELGLMLSEKEDVLCLKDKLNINICGIKNSENAGYEILKLWTSKANTTLRVLRRTFLDMNRRDLADKLDEFRKDYMTMVVVFHFEDKITEEVLSNIMSSQLVLEVIKDAVQRKYSEMIERTNSFVDILGYELCENVKCSFFRGKQLDVYLKQNEAMKSANHCHYHKYDLEDPISKLPKHQLETLGEAVCPNKEGIQQCLQLGHLLGIKKETKSAIKILQKWAEFPCSTFRVLLAVFTKMERDDLKEVLQSYLEDPMTVNVLIICEDKRRQFLKDVPSQSRVLDVLRLAMMVKYQEYENSIRGVTFEINQIEVDGTLLCEEFRDKQIRVSALFNESLDIRNWPALEVACRGDCGFRDVPRDKAEELLRQRRPKNGTFILRYEDSTRYSEKPRYAISLMVEGTIEHLKINEERDEGNKSLYFFHPDTFHAPDIRSLLNHYSNNEVALGTPPMSFCLKPLRGTHYGSAQ